MFYTYQNLSFLSIRGMAQVDLEVVQRKRAHPKNSINSSNQINQTNQINGINRTNQINPINPTDQFNLTEPIELDHCVSRM